MSYSRGVSLPEIICAFAATSSAVLSAFCGYLTVVMDDRSWIFWWILSFFLMCESYRHGDTTDSQSIANP